MGNHTTNPDIEVNKPFVRFKKPDGTWTVDIDATLIKIIDRGDINDPVQISIESEARGTQVIQIQIDAVDITTAVDAARQ